MDNLIELGIFAIIFLQFCATIFGIASDPVIEQSDGSKRITTTGKATIGVAIIITIVAFGMQYHQIKAQNHRIATSQGGLIYSAHLLMLEAAGALVAPDFFKRHGRRALDERREILSLTLLTSQSSLDSETIRLTRSMDEVIRRWLRVIDINESLDPALPKKMYEKSRDFKRKLCDKFVWLDMKRFQVMEAKYEIDDLHLFCGFDEGPMREVFEKQCASIKPKHILCRALSIIDLANSQVAPQEIKND